VADDRDLKSWNEPIEMIDDQLQSDLSVSIEFINELLRKEQTNIGFLDQLNQLFQFAEMVIAEAEEVQEDVCVDEEIYHDCLFLTNCGQLLDQGCLYVRFLPFPL
jgi:hypothetical protein